MPEEGFEPSRPEGQWILSPSRLPVPPLRPLFILLSFLEISMFFQLLNFNQSNFNQNCAILKNPPHQPLLVLAFRPLSYWGLSPRGKIHWRLFLVSYQNKTGEELSSPAVSSPQGSLRKRSLH